MLQKRRSARASTKTSIRDEIAHLRGLDLKGLRSRWQSVFQRPPPDHLPRHLLFAIVAYRIQVDRLGDLDHETRQVLDRTDSNEIGSAVRLSPFTAAWPAVHLRYSMASMPRQCQRTKGTNCTKRTATTGMTTFPDSCF